MSSLHSFTSKAHVQGYFQNIRVVGVATCGALPCGPRSSAILAVAALR